jgi:regulator of protease activity HflC (stomatin/prohibitin superfamily)
VPNINFGLIHAEGEFAAAQRLSVAAIIVGLYLLSSVKVLAEYERGVIFRLGRLLPKATKPKTVAAIAA